MATCEETPCCLCFCCLLCAYNYFLSAHCKITYVWKQPLIYVTQISCYYILNYKEKLLNYFSKIYKKYFGCASKIVIWKFWKILRNMSMVKLSVTKVINVEFLSRDLPLINSSIIVKWKCLQLLYSSKWICWIESQ